MATTSRANEPELRSMLEAIESNPVLVSHFEEEEDDETSEEACNVD